MRLKATYNGYELTKHCKILNVYPSIMPEVSNTFMNHPTNELSKLKSSKLNPIRLTIEIGIEDNISHHIEQLAKILYQDEVKPLIISDKPDRYLNCKLDGGSLSSSRFRYGVFKLNFVSEDTFWRDVKGSVRKYFNSQGRVVVDNKGTARTTPKFEVDFNDDCGYLALVSPNGYLAIGNPQEVDTVILPPSEYAMNEEMTDLRNFKYLTNPSGYPYMGNFKVTNRATTNEWGASINPNERDTSENWQGYAYERIFDTGKYDQTADDFLLESRMDIYDANGTNSGLNSIILAVLTEDNRIVMGANIYDNSGDKNDLVVKFFTQGSQQGFSRTIHTDTLSRLNGSVTLEKRGNLLSFVVNHNGSQGKTQPAISTRDTVYIKDSARYGWHHNGTRYSVQGFTRGRPNTIRGVRTFQGKKQFEIIYGGFPIYWMNEEDLTTNRVVSIGSPPKSIRHYAYNSAAGQMKASKVFVASGGWKNRPIYSHNIINSIKVQRRYSSLYRDIENIFMKGDKLEIDNETGEILLNGTEFAGLVDVDSKFFKLDGGPTEVALETSSWASMPFASIEYESRWLN